MSIHHGIRIRSFTTSIHHGSSTVVADKTISNIKAIILTGRKIFTRLSASKTTNFHIFRTTSENYGELYVIKLQVRIFFKRYN